MSERHWRKINIWLLISIIIVNLYTIALPFLPTFNYWWKHRGNETPPSVTIMAKTSTPQADNNHYLPGNRLIIPRMDMNTEIIEGTEQNWKSNLRKGAWRLPFSSNPATGSNTVIAGHRFTYTESRSIFYYLDKLQIGDEIGMQWNGKLYTYKVVSSQIVSPTAIEVQQPSDDKRLTLYTCTPLIHPVNRLVVVAKPVSEVNL